MTTREQIESEIKQRQEWLAILADFEAGHQMQVELDGNWQAWSDHSAFPSTSSMSRYQFRRKPQPMRGFVNLYNTCTFETLEQAKQYAGASCIGQAEFVQVI